MRSGLRYRLAGEAGGLLLDALFVTTRCVREGENHPGAFTDHGSPVIFVLWHGRLLPLSYYHRNRGYVTLISRSADGEYIARVVERWGYGTVRGSSSRGGTGALREMARHLRGGRTLSVTPDGPRGPRERLKPGVLMAARLTGTPLIPVSASASRAWWIEGWDRFLVPKPFARVSIVYGAPHFVSRDADEAELARRSAALESALADTQRRADALAAGAGGRAA